MYPLISCLTLVLPVLKELVLLFDDLKDSLMALFASGPGPQFLKHGQNILQGGGYPHLHGLFPTVVVGHLVVEIPLC